MFRKPSEAELIELENSLIPPLLEEIEARAGWYPKPDRALATLRYLIARAQCHDQRTKGRNRKRDQEKP